MNHIEKSKDPRTSLNELRQLIVKYPDQVFLNPIFELLLIETPGLMSSIPESLLADAIEHCFCPDSALSYIAQMSSEALQLAVLKNPETPDNVVQFLQNLGRTDSVRSTAVNYEKVDTPWSHATDIVQLEYWAAYIDSSKTVEGFCNLLSNKDIPWGIRQLALIKLAGASDRLRKKSRIILANDPKTSLLILKYLARNSEKAVRIAALDNLKIQNNRPDLIEIDRGLPRQAEQSNNSGGATELSRASIRHYCRTRSILHWNISYKDSSFDDDLKVYLARSPEIDSGTARLLLKIRGWDADVDENVGAALVENPSVNTGTIMMIAEKIGANRYDHDESIESYSKELVNRLIKLRLNGLSVAIREWKEDAFQILESYTKVSFPIYALDNPRVLSLYYDKDLSESIDNAVTAVHEDRYWIGACGEYGENDFAQVGGYLFSKSWVVEKACSIMFSDWDDLYDNYGYVIEDANYEYEVCDRLALYFLSLFPLKTKESRDLFLMNLAGLAVFTRYGWLQHHVPYDLK